MGDYSIFNFVKDFLAKKSQVVILFIFKQVYICATLLSGFDDILFFFS